MEIDYQLALLLQHKFEQDAKKPKEYNSDLELAKSLQQQFETENEVGVPKNGLVYKNSPKSSANSAKCLVDPSWEVIDPTPDIHVLFMSFNDRFFWGSLMAVCVSWSKRMTTCAGICSYQGRGGLCSITLSEPLLKLRPRKDLVETLLHEMIHAHLFVTNNNRDRDGHGPEFHKHMFRINKEAGTNITVYHDFHDEVRLYKQHWWRCDGPCQNRRPYFGMVRRATNRAPGPYDRWWGEHSRNCGGNFIKVKEPEKVEKPNKKVLAKENIKPKEDIRKFLSPIKSDTLKTTPPTSKNTKPLGNVHTLNNNKDDKKINQVIPKANNIFGFTNLNGNVKVSKGKGGGTSVKNSSSTIVINKKPSTSTKSDVETTARPSSSGKAQSEKFLSETSRSSNSSDYATVRNRWLNKYSNTNSMKRSESEEFEAKPSKVPKLNESKSENAEPPNCPVCLEPIPLTQFNEHLDKCLEKPKTKECIICGREIAAGEYETHVTKCSEENLDDVFEKSCTICEKSVPVVEFDAHAEKCLLKFYDDMEEKYSEKNENVDCLSCGKSIVTSELSGHLDDCVGLSRVFEDDSSVEILDGDNSVEVIDDDGASDSRKENRFNCPFCMVLVPEHKMNAHVDSCLSTRSGSSESEWNKSVLIKILTADF